MNFELIENKFLQTIGKKFSRSPEQINQFLESDAELLRLPDGNILAVTTDCIAEEIASGLYSEPSHIGWMTVVVNLSDLAAVGAQPLGILLSESLPENFPVEKLNEVQEGIADACMAFGTFVLGGDTNQSKAWQMGGTALGLIPVNEPVISRKGANAGDALYCSGPMGLGSAFAFEILFSSEGKTNINYHPVPRLKEGKLIRQTGSACIDTSDGFFHALCNLMEVNEIGFNIEIPFTGMVHPEILRLQKEKQIPSWIFLAGPHGEFELLFTIPHINKKRFEEEAGKMNWNPIYLGTCTSKKSCTILTIEGTKMELFPCQIANAYSESHGDPKLLLNQLLKFESQWKIQQKIG